MALLDDETGAGTLEYGVMLALVAMVAIAGLLLLGGNSHSSLNRSATQFPSGSPGLSGTP